WSSRHDSYGERSRGAHHLYASPAHASRRAPPVSSTDPHHTMRSLTPAPGRVMLPTTRAHRPATEGLAMRATRSVLANAFAPRPATAVRTRLVGAATPLSSVPCAAASR